MRSRRSSTVICGPGACQTRTHNYVRAGTGDGCSGDTSGDSCSSRGDGARFVLGYGEVEVLSGSHE